MRSKQSKGVFAMSVKLTPPRRLNRTAPRRLTTLVKPRKLARGLSNQVIERAIDELQPSPDNPRLHSDEQIERLARSIERLGWTSPVIIDENGTILAGHARVEAARRRGWKTVPTLCLRGLSECEKRAIVIADNRLPEKATWDFDLLKKHFVALIDADFDVELTGFSTGEVDLRIDGQPAGDGHDLADAFEEPDADVRPTSRPGDLWHLGQHALLCGDARDPAAYRRLMGATGALMVFCDPPYGVRIHGHAMGRGRIKHPEFIMASGEMSEAEYVRFLTDVIAQLVAFTTDGSIHFIFIDWRHIFALLSAARGLYAEFKNLIVWNKDNAGQGAFYRSKHELIGVFKNGTGRHVNNFGLGATGRCRNNVWDFPSVNSLHPARRGDLELHPTVKPVALVADAIRDCSKRNSLILDPFVGSGTTILAAERTGRIARAMELDPRYVDVAVRRWETLTGNHARLADTGQTFAESADARHPAEHRRSPPSGGKHVQAS